MSDTPSALLAYLQAMNKHKASDLYLTVGRPAMLRIDNGLMPISDSEMTLETITEIVNSILTSKQKREFDSTHELNSSLDIGKYGRFRVNILKQRQKPALVIRRIITKIPKIEELMLPEIFKTLALEKRGLILIAGITGSGKTTTLASMLDHRNEQEEGHLVTIEDPIEYFHDHKKSIVTQREVGVDTDSYEVALKNALRQRPDVILIGEIREREVMEQALTAAETGHLCLATIHATNAYQALERIVNLFPKEMAKQIRLNLSLNLKAVFAQRLLPSLKGGMVPAIEVMLNKGLIRQLIFNGEVDKIKSIMEQNSVEGMCSFDQSIQDLYANKKIAEEVALAYADRTTDMKVKIQQSKLEEADKGQAISILSSLDTSPISLND